MKGLPTVCVLLAVLLVVRTTELLAQGTKTGSINGIVTKPNGDPVPDASVIALHEPSGTTYGARTRADGRVAVPGMRVGGPYRVTVSLIGFESAVQENVFVTLGVATDLQFTMREVAVTLEEVTVTAQHDAIFSSGRTGAATFVGREALERLPTISGR